MYPKIYFRNFLHLRNVEWLFLASIDFWLSRCCAHFMQAIPVACKQKKNRVIKLSFDYIITNKLMNFIEIRLQMRMKCGKKKNHFNIHSPSKVIAIHWDFYNYFIDWFYQATSQISFRWFPPIMEWCSISHTYDDW